MKSPRDLKQKQKKAERSLRTPMRQSKSYVRNLKPRESEEGVLMDDKR